jgi:AcrR family transcriptional regulator
MSNIQKQYHHGALKAAIVVRATAIIEEKGIEALSLRGIARDLGVSHGAPNRHFKTKAHLLSALATDAWESMSKATQAAAENEVSKDPRDKLNAMGRGFLTWALQNRATYVAVIHPDVERHRDQALLDAIEAFQATVRKAVAAAQSAGRQPDVDTTLLALFTISVPFGLAALLSDPSKSMGVSEWEQEDLVARLINLVVPRHQAG